MFFDDSEAAFANLHRATAPDGRLVFVCWQPVDENPWFLVPLMALAPAARALLDAGEDVRAEAAVRVRDALAPSARDGVVHLSRAAWIVTART